MTNLQTVTIEQLRKIVAIKEEIERLEAQLDDIGGRPRRDRPAGITAAPVVRRRRRKMSAEAKARIGAAQRARWARVKRNIL